VATRGGKDENKHQDLEMQSGESVSLSRGPYHVFLTHDWGKDTEGRDNHKRVSRINVALQKRGIITWFDEDRMEGLRAQVGHE